MYVDALTISAVVAELAGIVGGRIQRVTIPSRLSIALEVYAAHRRSHVILSAHPRHARIHLSAAKPSRGVGNETPLLLLLRKYLVGGVITAVTQPALERIVNISIARRGEMRNQEEAPDEDAEIVRTELIIEVMEQRSNIVLVNDANIILDCVRRVPPALSRRPLLPHEPYESPPAQAKRDPRHATADGVAAACATGDLAKAMVAAYRGLSPLAAREVVVRALGRADTAGVADPWPALAAALRGLFEAPPQPSLVMREAAIVAFAPYALTHLAGWRAADAMSATLERFYDAHERLTNHQQRRDALRAQLGERRERAARRRQALAGELERTRDMDRLRWEGEMIFASLHTIAPGQRTLTVEERTIDLGAARTPTDAARERFRHYERLRSALEGVPERLREAELQLAGIDEMLALLELADGFDEIETIMLEAIDAGYVTPPGRRRDAGRRQAPLRVAASDGTTIYVGRSAGQNHQVTFRLASSDDVWLHARDIPGAHVVIKAAGRAPAPQVLNEAAGLAAYFSGARHEALVTVDVARRHQVRRIRGGPLGLVSYHAETSVRVAPAPPW
jgi:predicted ribosome quality control (RQC) complex YloA/Tae2 family protein